MISEIADAYLIFREGNIRNYCVEGLYKKHLLPVAFNQSKCLISLKHVIKPYDLCFQVCELELDVSRDQLNELVDQAAGLCFEVEGKAKFQTHPMMNDEWDITCQSFSWEALDCREEKFEVCFDMSEVHWYGAAQVREQLWPIDQWVRPSSPFINGDSFQDEYGGVQHRYFLASDGTAVTVEWDVPLWASFNNSADNSLCLQGTYKDSPYNNHDNTPLYFNYTMCNGINIRRMHQFIIETKIGKPSGIPDTRMFKYPIWSTWAQYHKDINQSIVLSYAQDINDHNFTNSQLEIDDKWESYYGELDFDRDKFPDPAAMVKNLTDMGFRTTLWVHPFTQVTTDEFVESAIWLQLVRDPGRQLPGLVSWWNGIGGLLDFTNNRTISDFSTKLHSLKANYNISSFKFDAGEVNWLPAAYSLTTPSRNPSRFTNRYAKAAYEVDKWQKNLEVRVGARTQSLPVFVRMMDKISTWDYELGLKSLIPTALTFSILGYPFILPDMIGGNAYQGVEPDRELYIRWVEANAFLPAIQFSIPPWKYDDEVVSICQYYVELHEQYSDEMIRLAHSAVITGNPIIRPLWWIDVRDEDALTSDSQFLVGNDILVAPVVEQGARSRDIFIPTGRWHDELRGGVLEGPDWLYNYTVELHELAYFTSISAEKYTTDET